MKWKNASIDDPPKNNQDLLIVVNGVYYVAYYCMPRNIYCLKDFPEVFFKPDECLIYWSEASIELVKNGQEKRIRV